MLTSNYVFKMSRYIRYGYAFARVSRANLQFLKEKRELFSYGNSSFILTKTERNHAEFSILAGTSRATLLKILKTARKMRVKTIGGFVPHDYYFIRTCKSLGFCQDSWGKHAILFQKNI
jgi:hypothetical protein